LNIQRQILVCADDVNLLGENINAIKKNTQALLTTSKDDLKVISWLDANAQVFECPPFT